MHRFNPYQRCMGNGPQLFPPMQPRPAQANHQLRHHGTCQSQFQSPFHPPMQNNFQQGEFQPGLYQGTPTAPAFHDKVFITPGNLLPSINQPDSVMKTQSSEASQPTEPAIPETPVEYTGEHGPEVKMLTECVIKNTQKLKSMLGGALFFGDSGNPPVIPDVFMARDAYFDRNNKLKDAVDKAERKYEALTGSFPDESAHFGEFVFGTRLGSNLPENVRVAAADVKEARMKLCYFINKCVAVDLEDLRKEILCLHSGITKAKHQLRALQFQGVNIGTQIFPDLSLSFDCASQ